MHERLTKAYHLAKSRENNPVSKEGLGELLWPDSNYETRRQNVYKLFSGKLKMFRFEWIGMICDYFNVDANFLFKTDSHD